MADAKNKAADPAPAADPSYYEVFLNRKVSFYGFDYKPGVRHVVDEATLALFGDAVESKRKV